MAYTIATHKTPELERLINSFKKSNIPLVILGFGCKWQGFGNKLLWFKEHLEKYGDNNHIALFVDAYDVVCVGQEQEIIKKFVSFKKPIVFSGEKAVIQKLLLQSTSTILIVHLNIQILELT